MCEETLIHRDEQFQISTLSKKIVIDFEQRKLFIAYLNEVHSYNFSDIKWCTPYGKEKHKFASSKRFIKDVFFIAFLLVIAVIIGSFIGNIMAGAPFYNKFSLYGTLVNFIAGCIVGLIYACADRKNKDNICTKLQVKIIMKSKKENEIIDFVSSPVLKSSNEYINSLNDAESLVDEIKYSIIANEQR